MGRHHDHNALHLLYLLHQLKHTDSFDLKFIPYAGLHKHSLLFVAIENTGLEIISLHLERAAIMQEKLDSLEKTITQA